jgi:hypothetical protein
MKKSLIILLTAATITGNAQNWLTTLNSGATTLPKFGLSTNHSLSFFTNNAERMKLTNTGRLGIGQANPAYALDVTGEIRASTNIRTGQKMFFGSTGQLQMAYTAPAVAGNPGILGIGNSNVSLVTPNLSCGTINSDLLNGPSITQFNGLINMVTTTSGPALNISAVTSGAYVFSGNSPLYINKCGNNVNVCSDGSGNMGVGALADLNARLFVSNTDVGLTVKTLHAADNMYNTTLVVDRNNAKALTAINVGNGSSEENFIVYGDGRTRIGGDYTSVNQGNYKLSVNGKIISEEVVIMLRANWPDYVFSKGYKLMPLNRVEEYIQKNAHLPNMPTATEIKETGIATGDILNKHMEKIEELTLYLIEMKKEIELLKAENAILKEKIK